MAGVFGRGDLEGPLPIVKQGIGGASTFRGFCKLHDHYLFHNIEGQGLASPRPDQSFSLAMRAFAHEYCRKRMVRDYLRLLLRDREVQYPPVASAFIPVLEEDISRYRYWCESIGEVELAKLFAIYARADFEGVGSLWKKRRENLGVSLTAIITPAEAIESGNELIGFPWVSVNLVPTIQGTYFVASWLPDSAIAAKLYLRSHDTVDGFNKIVNRAISLDSENVCLSPSVWLGFSEEQRLALQLAIRAPWFRELDTPVPRLVYFEEKNE